MTTTRPSAAPHYLYEPTEVLAPGETLRETLEALSLSRVLPAIDEQLDRPFERRRVGHAALSEPR